MLKRCFCMLLGICLLLSCTACGKKPALEEVKAAMVAELKLSPVEIGAEKAAAWYGITADNCEQAVIFMLTEALCPGEVMMVKAADAEAAALIAATTSRRLSSLKTQVSDRGDIAVQQDGKYVTMFFSAQYAAMQAVYDEYMK